MEKIVKEYIRRLLKELNWDVDNDKIIKFRHKKGLNMMKDGIKIEKIFIVREVMKID